MEDLTGVGKLADSEVAKRAYEDVAAEPAKQAGHLAADTIKAFRLFTAPIQLLATAQDRFERWLSKVRDTVPAERQIDAAPEIAGPALLNLRFMSDESELRHLYLNLLTLAIDSDNCAKAHPGFVKVIEQLSPKDAQFLKALSNRVPLDKTTTVETELPAAVIVQQSGAPFSSWHIPDIQCSLDLLRGLSVVHFEFGNVANFGGDPHKCVEVEMTQFGKNFVAACLPTESAAAQESS